MRAVTIHEATLSWNEHPDPDPGVGEVLVRIRAAGINAADLMQRQGFYPAPPGSPADIPGMELAGEVVGAGPHVTSWKPGDRVMAVVGGGAQAEYAVVHERLLLPVPDGVPWDQAGGFPEAFTTAHDALFSQCELAVGERVLVHGAAGGVGSAAVQLAAAAGASVVATVRDATRRDAVEDLAPGVRAVPPDDFAARGPFDVVLELVGAQNMTANLDALAIGGRIAVIGVAGSGAAAEVNLLTLMGRRARIHGSTLRARPLEQKALAARRVAAHVLPLLSAGRVRVPVADTFLMEHAPAAYDRFAAGGKFGKIVLLAG